MVWKKSILVPLVHLFASKCSLNFSLQVLIEPDLSIIILAKVLENKLRSLRGLLLSVLGLLLFHHLRILLLRIASILLLLLLLVLILVIGHLMLLLLLVAKSLLLIILIVLWLLLLLIHLLLAFLAIWHLRFLGISLSIVVRSLSVIFFFFLRIKYELFEIHIIRFLFLESPILVFGSIFTKDCLLVLRKHSKEIFFLNILYNLLGVNIFPNWIIIIFIEKSKIIFLLFGPSIFS
mmetsp:Transcript_30731/g.27933  ORF Transcript_30731/g.27933 Transcript_30731/m.27933 type:complete len:235 (+) Transcript_30731:1115-1819(+)